MKKYVTYIKIDNGNDLTASPFRHPSGTYTIHLSTETLELSDANATLYVYPGISTTSEMSVVFLLYLE